MITHVFTQATPHNGGTKFTCAACGRVWVVPTNGRPYVLKPGDDSVKHVVSSQAKEWSEVARLFGVAS